MLIWAANRPERDALTPPRDGRVETVPRQPADHPNLHEVEVLIPPYRDHGLLDSLPQMSGLRLIQTLESGVEWLLPYVPDGVPLCNARGVHDAAVAEWVVGVILAMQRQLPDHLLAQQNGLWRNIVSGSDWKPPFSGDLQGSTALIVGYGSIGAAVERRLQPFDVEFLRVARRTREGVRAASELPDLIALADIVIVLVPLTPATEQMIDANLLGAMKPGALLVNAGRGRVIDQSALVDALQAGRIRAALDVTDPEPLPKSNPLWSAQNLLLTPHMAGDTPCRFQRSWQLVSQQIERLRSGEPLQNIVSRE